MHCLTCGTHFKRGQAGQQRHCSTKCRFAACYTVAPSGCWEWQRATFKSGYGAINVNGRIAYAHRVSFELFVGPIVDGAFVMHACDNRICVNPTHLLLGSPADNVQDMMAKGRNHWQRWDEEERAAWVAQILEAQKRSPSHRAYAGGSKGSG